MLYKVNSRITVLVHNIVLLQMISIDKLIKIEFSTEYDETISFLLSGHSSDVETVPFQYDGKVWF